jgi:hypothetical protein
MTDYLNDIILFLGNYNRFSGFQYNILNAICQELFEFILGGDEGRILDEEGTSLRKALHFSLVIHVDSGAFRRLIGSSCLVRINSRPSQKLLMSPELCA